MENCNKLHKNDKLANRKHLKVYPYQSLSFIQKTLGRQSVSCSTMACAISMYLQMKHQTSREKMLTLSGQYCRLLLSPGTTGMSGNHFNYMDKATGPQKNLYPDTCCLLPISASKRQQLILQASNKLGYLCLNLDYILNRIKSCFLLNSRHINITHRAENSPGS